MKKWRRRIGPVTNLYKLDLPKAWRALYTLGSEGPNRVVLVIEILDHRGYDRVLGYDSASQLRSGREDSRRELNQEG